jgi:hypothetical protein
MIINSNLAKYIIDDLRYIIKYNALIEPYLFVFFVYEYKKKSN